MILEWLLVLGGFALLVGGGDALVRGASGIALFARLTPAVVGLTIVAAGTSMPELVVSVRAALEPKQLDAERLRAAEHPTETPTARRGPFLEKVGPKNPGRSHPSAPTSSSFSSSSLPLPPN